MVYTFPEETEWWNRDLLTPLLPCPKTVDMREMAVAVGAKGAKMGM